MSSKILIVFSLTLLYISSSLQAEDKTLEDKAKGHDVVCAVIKKITDSGIFPDDKGILRRIAWVESKFGNDKGTFRDNYYGGIWQIDAGKDGAFTEITKNAKSHTQLNTNIIPKVNAKFGINITNMKYEDLLKPLYSGLFARMRLFITADSIPENYNLSGQANYWKKNYNSDQGKGTPDKFIKDVKNMEKEFGPYCDNCQGRMNLAIVMDGSGSIRRDNYIFAKKAVENLLDTFSNQSVDVGFVVFSSTSEIVFPLNSNLTRKKMKDKIESSDYPGESTRTDLGIDDGTRILSNVTTKVGVPKVMAVFTDGNPDSVPWTLQAVNSATRSNITIFGIGIGSSIDYNNLLQMAKTPQRVLSITSYEALSQSFQQINSQTCRVPQNPEIGKRVDNDQLARNEKRYFKFAIPEKGITVKIEVNKGKTTGYYSYDTENPSSAVNDGEFTKEVFIQVQKKYMNVLDDVKKEMNQTHSVYVTIEGNEDHNQYSLDSSEGNHTSASCMIKFNMFTIVILFSLLFIMF